MGNRARHGVKAEPYEYLSKVIWVSTVVPQAPVAQLWEGVGVAIFKLAAEVAVGP